MKRFLRDICSFVLPLLAVAAVLECVLERIPNSYTYKAEYLQSHAKDIRTLFMGSSYGYDGFFSSAVPGSFNFANSSQCFEDDYLLLCKFFEQRRLALGGETEADSAHVRVFLPVGYCSMNDVSRNYRRTYYTIYMDLYPRWPLSRYSFEVLDLQLACKKIGKYIISWDVTRCDSLGQRVGHTPEASVYAHPGDAFAEDMKLVRNDSYDISLSQGNIAANRGWLLRIDSICQLNAAELIIVGMPCTPTYRAAISENQWQVLLDAIPAGATFLDMRLWGSETEEQIENNFYNATHLNTIGASLFTADLMNKIRIKNNK